jgi:hypothetical protein
MWALPIWVDGLLAKSRCVGQQQRLNAFGALGVAEDTRLGRDVVSRHRSKRGVRGSLVTLGLHRVAALPHELAVLVALFLSFFERDVAPLAEAMLGRLAGPRLNEAERQASLQIWQNDEIQALRYPISLWYGLACLFVNAGFGVFALPNRPVFPWASCRRDHRAHNPRLHQAAN